MTWARDQRKGAPVSSTRNSKGDPARLSRQVVLLLSAVHDEKQMEDSVVFWEVLAVERPRWAWSYNHFVAMEVLRLVMG
jgi:hypothetical protein